MSDAEKCMQNTIYVIIRGEYSDWEIVGYAASEDEAISICARRNGRLASAGFAADLYYYDCIHKIVCEEILQAAPAYEHIVAARDYNRKVVFKYLGYEDDYLYENGTQGRLKWDRPRSRDASIYVYAPLETPEAKILKIAQDLYYQRLAEIELRE